MSSGEYSLHIYIYSIKMQIVQIHTTLFFLEGGSLLRKTTDALGITAEDTDTDISAWINVGNKMN